MLCRLCASQWVALSGSYHGQLVWQRQEGPDHGPLECTHQCWQHAGMLSNGLCMGIFIACLWSEEAFHEGGADVPAMS